VAELTPHHPGVRALSAGFKGLVLGMASIRTGLASRVSVVLLLFIASLLLLAARSVAAHADGETEVWIYSQVGSVVTAGEQSGTEVLVPAMPGQTLHFRVGPGAYWDPYDQGCEVFSNWNAWVDDSRTALNLGTAQETDYVVPQGAKAVYIQAFYQPTHEWTQYAGCWH
jgi:hypothetical protein